ncbi:MAG: hypothetical protein EBU26_13125 [Verrucomicrobia bacterium]|nr:hypothetical protein [Verrucomicrobiota bacterium]
MRGGVVVTQFDRNLRLDTETLNANLKAGEMHTNSVVIVRDTTREITAEKMQAFDNGARIIFGGTTHGTLADGMGASNLGEAYGLRCVEHQTRNGEQFLRFLKSRPARVQALKA